MCNCVKSTEILPLNERNVNSCIKLIPDEILHESCISDEWTWDVIGCFVEETTEKILALGDITMQEIEKASLVVKNFEKRMDEFARRDPIFDIETAEPYSVAINNKNVMKLAINRAYVEKFLIQLGAEIRGGTYKELNYCIHDLLKFVNEERRLRRKLEHNLYCLRILNVRRQHEESDRLQDLQALTEIVRKYDDASGRLIIQNAISAAFTEERVKANNEIDAVKYDIKKKNLLKKIGKFKFEFEKELTNHYDVYTYLYDAKTDVKARMVHWKNRIDTEFDSLQIDLYIMAEKREELEKKFQDISLKYKAHKDEIETYLLYEDEQERIAEEQAKLNAMATKIQAWWRGLMVRLQLGPYNPKKKKKGKAKGAKGAKGRGKKAK